MERIDPAQVSSLLRDEHEHRYRWAASFARGRVLDAACGVGYGSALLLQSSRVAEYTGVDIAPEAIEHAKRAYADPRASFLIASVNELPFDDAAFDSVVSLETIEHLDDPHAAITQFARVLKPGGMLLASVPQRAFEEACELAYGPNEHHKRKFTPDDLVDLIRTSFHSWALWDAGLRIVSMIQPGFDQSREASADAIVLEPGADLPRAFGSLLVLASRNERVVAEARADGACRLLPSVSVVEHDQLHVTPRVKAISAQAKLIEERGVLLRKQDEAIAERNAIIRAQGRAIEDRDRALEKAVARTRDLEQAYASTAKMVEERVALIKKQDDLVAARDKTIADLRARVDELAKRATELATQDADKSGRLDMMNKMLEERALANASLSATLDRTERALSRARAAVNERDKVVHSQARLVDERDALVAKLEAWLRDRDDAIRAQAKLVDERDAYIRKLEGMYNEASALADSRESALKEAQEGVQRAQQRVDEVTGELNHARSQLAALEGSFKQAEANATSLDVALADLRAEAERQRQMLHRPGYCLRLAARALVNSGPSVDGRPVNGRASPGEQSRA
ncbi:MAG: methyltransferase domain-containing protein [Planctomycetota bacterium]|nr:methyltransferase domain-containing protein [Planctomycetota bacterium]